MPGRGLLFQCVSGDTYSSFALQCSPFGSIDTNYVICDAVRSVLFTSYESSGSNVEDVMYATI